MQCLNIDERRRGFHDEGINYQKNMQTSEEQTLAPPGFLTPDPSPSYSRQFSFGATPVSGDDHYLRQRPQQRDFFRSNTVLENLTPVRSPDHIFKKKKLFDMNAFDFNNKPLKFWIGVILAIPLVMLVVLFGFRFSFRRSPVVPSRGDRIHPALSSHHTVVKPKNSPKEFQKNSMLSKSNRDSLLAACESGDSSVIRAILGHADKGGRLILANVELWDGDLPLHRAARFGQVEVLKLLTGEYHVSLAERNHNDDMAIHLAAMEGHWGAIEYIGNQAIMFYQVGGHCKQTPLHRAALNGHLDIVRRLVKKGVKIDVTGGCDDAGQDANEMPIHLAARMGHVDVVSFFVDHYADSMLEAKNGLGRTPLLVASLYGQKPILELLVARGADVFARDTDHSMALHLASSQLPGNIDIVDYLTTIKPGLIDKADGNGMTPMMTAAKVGNLRIVRFLIADKGANIQAETDDGYQAIHLAAFSGNADLINFLIDVDGILPQARTDEGELPIHVAAFASQIKAISTFAMLNKAQVEAPGYAGRTPLLTAVAKGELNTVRYLIDYLGADPKAKSSPDDKDFGANALHLATRYGHRLLVTYFANLKPELANIPDARGDLPLHTAAVFDDQLLALDMLITTKRTDINAVGHGGRTPLVAAVVANRTKAVDILLLRGADPNVWVPYGDKKFTTIHIAAHLGLVEIGLALLAAKPELIDVKISNGDLAIHLAAAGDKVDFVEMMVTKHPELIEAPGFSGRTPLLAASTAGQIRTLTLLMKLGANVFAKDAEFKSTALHLASRFGHVSVVEQVLAYAPDLLSVANGVGDQPIHRAVFGGSIDTIHLLLDENADIEARGELGRTPLLLACTRGLVEVVNFLVERGADIMVKDQEHGVSALHLAAYFNHEAMVNRLLEISPSLLSSADYHGHTALDMAKQRKLDNIVSILEKFLPQ